MDHGIRHTCRFGCPACGQPLPAPGPCPNRWCARPDRGWSVVFSASLHQGHLRYALARYKYRDERWWGPVFGAVLADYLESHQTWFEDFDLVAGVPSYTGPGARRAWDPVGEIMAALRSRLGRYWDVAPAAVTKRFETPGLQGRSWPDRQRLASGPIRSSLEVPEPTVVAGARVLVVDDVFTEGSTLREVARVLTAAGALEVGGLVLGRLGWDLCSGDAG